ncbi:MAG: hypothetical protein RIT19_2340 [Verrucomicrobiota bacterium]
MRLPVASLSAWRFPGSGFQQWVPTLIPTEILHGLLCGGLSILLASVPLSAQPVSPLIQRDSIARPDAGGLAFAFTADPIDPGSFRIQVAGSLASPVVWTLDPGATITETVPGRFEARIPPVAQEVPRFYRVLVETSVAGLLQITEVMSDTTAVFPDTAGAFWDWIEVFNPQDRVIALGGFALSDDPLKPGRWRFPERWIQPGESLVVYASGLDRVGPAKELHTDFRLDAAGETLTLSDSVGRIVDQVTVPRLGPNESLGRPPNPEAGEWVVYSKSQSTPGGANGVVALGPPLPPPVFSVDSGFHAAGAEVVLELRGSPTNALIRYTTNGDPVTVVSPAWSGPLRISRSMVVRAKAYLEARSSAESIRSYFFGVSHDLPVISLAAAGSNFDFKNGYLIGMGTSVLSASGQVLQSYPYSGSNAWKDREIEVGFEFFDADHQSKVRQKVGMSVYGGWGSRGYPQKSYALSARAKYGDGNLAYRFFPDRPMDEFEALVLRNSGNDNQSTHQTAVRSPITQFGPVSSYGSYFVNGQFTLMRDALLQRLLDDTGLDTQAYRPAVVYLNGDYWGLHNLREKLNEHYVIGNHSVPRGGLDLIEGYGTVIAGDSQAYTAMRSFVTTKDLTIQSNLDTLLDRHLDLDNFLDYHASVAYFQNFDIGNVKCWRPRVPNGRFRWIVYDQDYGFHLWRPEVYVPAMARDYASYDNMFAFLTAGTGTGTGWPNEGGRTLMLRRLLTNPGVRTRFIQRCADLLNGPFREERVEATIRSMAAVIRPEIPRHLQRWSFAELQKRGYGKPYQAEYEPFTLATWEKNLDSLSDFARRRPAKLRQDCLDHFGLKQGVSGLQVETLPAGAGQVRLNRSVAAAAPWVGTFFRDVPVEATVIPSPGFRVIGWSGWGREVPQARWEFEPPPGTNTLTVRLEAYTPTPPARPPVILSELQYHPSSSADSGDWFELYNPGTEPVDLTGWILRDATDSNVAVVPGGVVAPGGYAVLCQDALRFQRAFPTGPTPLGEFGFGLGNGGDTLRIHAADGTLMLSLSYDDAAPWPVEADGLGYTLQLKNTDSYSGQPAAWKASVRVGGSPGAANP